MTLKAAVRVFERLPDSDFKGCCQSLKGCQIVILKVAVRVFERLPDRDFKSCCQSL